MARLREPKESTSFSRFAEWFSDGDSPLDQAMMDELSSASGVDTDAAADAHAVIEEKQKAARQALRQAYREYIPQHTNRGRKLYQLLAVLVSIGLIVILSITASRLPSFGSANDPIHNEVSQRYIENGMEETGAVNIVAGMILDYRAFDTLGESNVLFVAACAVLILLRISSEGKGSAAHQLEIETDDRMYEPKNDPILQFISSLLVPLILLFGMYVIMNGHISPGGGFSGGAVMGAGLILYLNAFGFRMTERFFTFRTFRTVSVAALSFYALSKAYSFFTGANELHSIITPGTPGMLFSAGLIPYLNLAVGLVVCCTMYAFYTLFRKGDL